MFIFALLYPLLPLFPVVAVALWSGILFKSYDCNEHGRVREISARCLGSFLLGPLLAIYLVQLWLFTFGSHLGLAFVVVLKIALALSLILLGIGLWLWLFLRLKGKQVEAGGQSVNVFMLKSWRLTAICSASATIFVLLIPAALSRLY